MKKYDNLKQTSAENIIAMKMNVISEFNTCSSSDRRESIDVDLYPDSSEKNKLIFNFRNKYFATQGQGSLKRKQRWKIFR